MFVRALIAFLVLPGVVAFLAPLLIAYSFTDGAIAWPAAIVVAIGVFVLLWCVRDFYVAGKGTLAPWSPPKRLVVVGLYRYVRNPMYVGVILVVVGWALTFNSLIIAGYAAALCIAFHLRVMFYEEPWLSSAFGQDWTQFGENVNRWVPRTTPWHPESERIQ